MMTLVNAGGSGVKGSSSRAPPGQIVKPPLQKQEPVLDRNTVPIEFVYMDKGKERRETREVPAALIAALTEPGESGRGPLQAMAELAEFYENFVRPGLDRIILEGIGDVPAAKLSSMIQGSYAAHAVVAATTKSVSRELFLEDPEADKLMRLTAAYARGVKVDEIRELGLEETTVWEGREVEGERAVGIEMEEQTLQCNGPSHHAERKVAVPKHITVGNAAKIREQRIARQPNVWKSFEKTCDKIAELRGSGLSTHEQNAVAAHINIKYIGEPEDKIVVVP